MAKRQPERITLEEKIMKRRALFIKLGWAFIILISVLFGYSYGYPIVAAGEVGKGILIGLVYGGGALMVILISFFLNRKLRGH